MDRIQDPEISLHIYGQLFFNKEDIFPPLNFFCFKANIVLIVYDARAIGYPNTKKNETWSVSCTINKNKIFCIPNIKPKTKICRTQEKTFVSMA